MRLARSMAACALAVVAAALGWCPGLAGAHTVNLWNTTCSPSTGICSTPYGNDGVWYHVGSYPGKALPFVAWVDDPALQTYVAERRNLWDSGTSIAFTNPVSDFYSNKIFVGDDHYANVGWAGLAQLSNSQPAGSANPGQSQLGNVYLNQDFIGTNKNATFSRAVVCQELGHVIGLGHEPYNTCMATGYYTNWSAYPDQDEYNAVSWFYAARNEP